MKSQPSDTGRLAETADAIDVANREADRIYQERYRSYEPDREFVAAEFDTFCRAEIAMIVPAFTGLRPSLRARRPRKGASSAGA